MQGAGGAPAQRRPLRVPAGHAWIAALVAFGGSQAGGWWVRSSPALVPGAERVVVPRAFSLTVLHNTGVAFGWLAGLPPAAAAVLALTVLGALFYNRGAWPVTRAGCWGLGLMLGGAAGNVVERIRFGYVLDYLDFHAWPVFNLADAAIVVGAGLLLLSLPRARR